MIRIRLAAWLIASAIGLLTARYIHSGYVECHPPHSRIREQERELARSQVPTIREVSFEGTKGTTLRGWFIPSRNGKVVVFVHGLGANRLELFPDARTLVAHGYGALLFDSRACGDSEGDVATWGYLEAEDIEQAVTFALHQPNVKRIAVAGHSVGASAAARAGAKDSRIGAVILYAVWTSLSEENRHRAINRGPMAAYLRQWGYRFSGVDLEAVSPITQVASIAPRPLLMISGLNDEDTPPQIMTRVFEQAGDPKSIWYVPGAGHGECFKVAPVEYERRVTQFLESALP